MTPPLEIVMTLELAKHRIELCEQAVAAARESGNLGEEGTALLDLGVAHFSLGKLDTAIKHYERALTISWELNDPQREVDALTHLATAYSLQGQVMRAIKFRQQAIAIYEKIGNRFGEAEQLNSLGVFFLSLKTPDPKSAIKHLQLALSVAREIDDREKEALGLSNLGAAYLLSKQPELALQCLEQSLTICRKIGNRHREADALHILATLHLQLGQAERARECGQEALSVAREIDNREKEARILLNLATIYSYLKQEGQAIEATQAAVQVLEETGGPEAAEARERLDHLRNPKQNRMASVSAILLVVILIVAFVGVRLLFSSLAAKNRQFQAGFWSTASALQMQASPTTIEQEEYVSIDELYNNAPIGLSNQGDWEQWENEYAGKYVAEKGKLAGLEAYPQEGKLFLMFALSGEEGAIENNATQVALLVEDAHHIDPGENQGSFLIDGSKWVYLGEDYAFEGRVAGVSLFDTELALAGHEDLIIVKGSLLDIHEE